MSGICTRHNLHWWLHGIKNELHFLAALAHPCLFPALYVFCSLFDIIWPTCLLSDSVCLTLSLSAFVFVLMFTDSSMYLFSLCLFLLCDEELCWFAYTERSGEMSHAVPEMFTCSYIILYGTLERNIFLKKNIQTHRPSIKKCVHNNSKAWVVDFFQAQQPWWKKCCWDPTLDPLQYLDMRKCKYCMCAVKDTCRRCDWSAW